MHTCFEHAWAHSPGRLALAAGVTISFAVVARALRGVTWSGAVGGGLACFALFAGIGPAAFASLATVFILTWLATRLGYLRKQRMGLAEKREGRDAGQVLANLAASGLAAVGYGAFGGKAWVVASIAGLAEAATDTVASEIGQSSRQDALMITTWERVRAGTDGGVTVQGTLAGAAACLVIAAVATLGGLLVLSEAWIPIAAGFAGMLADSLLGATIQRRGWISNQGVNFVATLAAVVVAYAVRNARR